MTKLFIPTDRIGLESIQKSISNTSKTLNKLLKQGIRIKWHINGLYLDKTPLWPEGHYYQCGFSMDHTETAQEMLKDNGIIWETLENIAETKLEIFRSKIALYSGKGAGADFSVPLIEIFEQGGFSFTQVDDNDIRSGKLSCFDIFVVPGSPDAGECYYAGLGKLGYERIREFFQKEVNILASAVAHIFRLPLMTPKIPTGLALLKQPTRRDLTTGVREADL